MTGKIPAIAAVTIAAILIMPGIGAAFAEGVYLGNTGSQDYAGAYTLEEALKLQRERVELAQQSPDKGSGTPLLVLDGALGASLVSGAVFGVISAAFFVKSRRGRYVAPGLG